MPGALSGASHMDVLGIPHTPLLHFSARNWRMWDTELPDVGCPCGLPAEKTRLAWRRVARPHNRVADGGPVAVHRGVDQRADHLRGVVEVLDRDRGVLAVGPGTDHGTVGPDAVAGIAVAVEQGVAETAMPTDMPAHHCRSLEVTGPNERR